MTDGQSTELTQTTTAGRPALNGGGASFADERHPGAGARIESIGDKTAGSMGGQRRVIAFFGHDANDTTVIKRAKAFQAHNSRVVGFMFRRARSVRQDPSWENVDLGVTVDLHYLKRIAKLASALVKVLRNGRLLRGCDIIYARNIDMLLLAIVAKTLSMARGVVVYEALDVRGVFIGDRLVNKAFRFAERSLLSASDLLVTSSPDFVEKYFKPVQGYQGRWFLLENKLSPLQIEDSDAARAPVVPLAPPLPIVIGWFGILKCARSFAILRRVAESLGARVEIYIRGIPSESDVSLREIEDACQENSNMTYGGPYSSPQDLGEIYSQIHVIWAADFLDAGANTHWCLPNRLYEGGFYGCVAVASSDTATGRMIDRDGLGWTIEEPLEEMAIRFFETLDLGEIVERRRKVLATSQSRFVDQTDTCELLDELDRIGNVRRTATADRL